MFPGGGLDADAVWQFARHLFCVIQGKFHQLLVWTHKHKKKLCFMFMTFSQIRHQDLDTGVCTFLKSDLQAISFRDLKVKCEPITTETFLDGSEEKKTQHWHCFVCFPILLICWSHGAAQTSANSMLEPCLIYLWEVCILSKSDKATYEKVCVF